MSKIHSCSKSGYVFLQEIKFSNSKEELYLTFSDIKLMKVKDVCNKKRASSQRLFLPFKTLYKKNYILITTSNYFCSQKLLYLYN